MCGRLQSMIKYTSVNVQHVMKPKRLLLVSFAQIDAHIIISMWQKDDLTSKCVQLG